MVYFIQSELGGPIKIGTTVRLTVRLATLRWETGKPLRVIGVMLGSHLTESVVHKRFAHRRLAGEWFEPEEDLLDFIASSAVPWDGTDEVPASRMATVRLPEDLMHKVTVVAALQSRTTLEVIEEVLREPLTELHRLEINKAAKAAGVEV